MKHAVLIMAHKNKEQLIRLIKSLDCAKFDFYVHLDSDWNLSKDELEEIENASEKGTTYLVKNRIHGDLFEWSLVQIEINLLKEAYNERYSYYILLSGQDYPIKSNRYIINFLEKQYPKPLIHAETYKKGNWFSANFDVVRWINRIDTINNNYKPGILRKIMICPLVIADYLEKKLYKSPYERMKKYNLTLCSGSQWWILPKDVILYVFDFLDNYKGFIKEIKRTRITDETFFQTLAYNSPLGYMIDINDSIYEKNDRKCLTYSNFRTPTKSPMGHPHIITSDDYERIIGKKQLFARKFDINVDSNILDLIDRKREE